MNMNAGVLDHCGRYSWRVRPPVCGFSRISTCQPGMTACLWSGERLNAGGWLRRRSARCRREGRKTMRSPTVGSRLWRGRKGPGGASKDSRRLGDSPTRIYGVRCDARLGNTAVQVRPGVQGKLRLPTSPICSDWEQHGPCRVQGEASGTALKVGGCFETEQDHSTGPLRTRPLNARSMKETSGQYLATVRSPR